jgi:hypothetical protein
MAWLFATVPGARESCHLEKAVGDWGQPDAGCEAVMVNIKVFLTDSQDF